MESCSSTPVFLQGQFSGVLVGRPLVRELVDILAAPPCAELPNAQSQLTLSTGSAAAALMAKLGVVPSKGAYAYLQSAAMGGYGSALAQGVTRAGSVAGEASSWLTSYWRGATSSRVDDNAEGERSQEAGVKADMPLKVKAKL